VFFLSLAFLGIAGSRIDAQPDTPKKGNEPKTKDSPFAKLPDGTYLWLNSPSDSGGERISLTPQELQKLLDQVDQLRKQLAVRKAVPPSGCAVRARVEKRGEQLVAVVKLTCTFRTTAPQSVISLGGRRGFLVAASLDGNKLPVLDTTDDGFAVLVETAGDHTLRLELDAPITARGTKLELGFELGLPRAAVTTFLFEPPGGEVKRVNITTRTPDPSQPNRPSETRRFPGLDVKQLTPRAGQEAGLPLGPIDSLEVTWDAPATSSQPADQVQSAELDLNVLLAESLVETTAKLRFRGPAGEWRFITPPNAEVGIDRAGGSDVGTSQAAVLSKPSDPNKPVWKIDFPAGTSPADWVITAVTRQARPKSDDPRHRGPFNIGPFTTLNVFRQTGTVRVTAGPNTRLTFTHGPDLRKAELPGPPDDEVTTAFFRLNTGPTGSMPVTGPLITFDARPLSGTVKVKPNYRLTLTDAGWRIRAEVRVFPIRAEVDSVAVDVPVEWRGLEASPPELVEGVQPGVNQEPFWGATAARIAGGLRSPVVVRLATGHKQPFDLILTATVPVEATQALRVVPLPRFPGSFERETTVTATVPEGFELRGESRDWDGEFAAWGAALIPGTDAANSGNRVVTTLFGKSDTGLSRVVLGWNRHRPELRADIRADVTLGDRQLQIVEQVRLSSADGLPRQIRFRGPASPAALRGVPALDSLPSGEWVLTIPSEAKEMNLTISYALSRPSRDEAAVVKVPVEFLWPVNATRVEAGVRIWSNTETGTAISTASAGWRVMQAETSPDRDTLPSLSLAASGMEPLELETRTIADAGLITAWVDRGFIQAIVSDDTVSYRARFLLRKRLTPTLELRLPGPLAGPNPEFLRDGLRVDATSASSGGDSRTFRVPLPPQSSVGTVVEVRYQLPATRGRYGEFTFQPPTLPTSSFTGPVRWHITMPHGSTPILAMGAAAEFRWRPNSFGIAPVAGSSSDAMNRWFATGEDSESIGSSETLTASQSAPASIIGFRISHTAVVIVCSVFAFVVVVLLSQLPGSLLGFGLVLVGGGLGVVTVFYPHVAAQAAGACQIGVAVSLVVVCLLGLARWAYHRRITRTPGFARSLPEPSAPAVVFPSSARNRPPGAAAPGPAPIAPAGG
jgi:hypothetical protein